MNSISIRIHLLATGSATVVFHVLAVCSLVVDIPLHRGCLCTCSCHRLARGTAGVEERDTRPEEGAGEDSDAGGWHYAFVCYFVGIKLDMCCCEVYGDWYCWSYWKC